MKQTVDPVIDHKVRGLCRHPYSGQPEGCPNFNRLERCPPKAPLFEEYFDLTQPVYAIWYEYDLAARAAELKAAHPDWSDKQCRCSRYWQSTARAELKIEIGHFLCEHPEYKSDLDLMMTPEAMGVNVFETMARIGVILDRHPVNRVYKVALAGIPKAGKTDPLGPLFGG